MLPLYRLTIRLSDAGVRRYQTKLLYSDHLLLLGSSRHAFPG
jgi:hypothetical protein